MDKNREKLFTFISLLYLILIIFFVSFSQKEHQNRCIKKLKIFLYSKNIHNNNYNNKVRNIVKKFLFSKNKKVKKKIGQLCILEIEKYLNKLPFVKRSEVFISINGVLNIKIYNNEQKEPIFNLNKKKYQAISVMIFDKNV
ncbi:hypothetical protein [Blattabacterium cuenoti]|uniref:hypothetical protein n=1 Tax=Blattabacterium cuenoti TaxID=1653831 RepID=UPI00163C044C|nr:hypothetical protein [Blattabacterium cuenoti]